MGGKKMSTSRGIGASAEEIVSIYPPELTRFLMLRTHPKRHIDFDPAGDTLPALLDEYDRCAEDYLRDPESDLAKVWRLSQVSPEPAPPPRFRVRFQLAANWIQIPSIAPEKEAEKDKGGPLDREELRDLHVRLELARQWLARWAPDKARFSVTPSLPAAAAELSGAQRVFLAKARDVVGVIKDAETMKTRLYDIAKEVGLVKPNGGVAQEAFAAVYIALLGRPDGPRAAWLIVALDPEMVRARFAEASRNPVSV
jgi:lysyl-tRNA synthetase, class I